MAVITLSKLLDQRATVQPPEPIKLGSLLAGMSRQTGLSNADVVALERRMDASRDPGQHEPIGFE